MTSKKQKTNQWYLYHFTGSEPPAGSFVNWMPLCFPSHLTQVSWHPACYQLRNSDYGCWPIVRGCLPHPAKTEKMAKMAGGCCRGVWHHVSKNKWEVSKWSISKGFWGVKWSSLNGFGVVSISNMFKRVKRRTGDLEMCVPEKLLTLWFWPCAAPHLDGQLQISYFLRGFPWSLLRLPHWHGKRTRIH